MDSVTGRGSSRRKDWWTPLHEGHPAVLAAVIQKERLVDSVTRRESSRRKVWWTPLHEEGHPAVLAAVIQKERLVDLHIQQSLAQVHRQAVASLLRTPEMTLRAQGLGGHRSSCECPPLFVGAVKVYDGGRANSHEQFSV